MTRRTTRALGTLALCLTAGYVTAHPSSMLHAAQLAGAASPQASQADLLFDQGKRLFDSFQYDQAVPIFDRVVAALTASVPVQRPDMLVQTYELRARARFALGDSPGAEQDLSALLSLNPSYRLGTGISPRVVTLFENVRKLTISQLVVSMDPAGDLQIDGRAYAATPQPRPIDMPAGDHQVTVARQGYRSVSQPLTLKAGESTTLALMLERVSATLAVVSIPSGAEIVFDGVSRGTTTGGDGLQQPSLPLLLTDLQLGAHRLQLRRSCYSELERTVNIDRLDDVNMDPLRMTPSVASVKIQTTEPGATVFVDGIRRGPAPADLTNICEGAHVIEVRTPAGRFFDRRDWKTGDAVTFAAATRSAFPIVLTAGANGLAAERLRTSVERSLATSRRTLVFAPLDTELQAALRGEDAPPDWLAVDAGAGQVSSRLSREMRRELTRKIASSLDVQGVVGLTGGTDPNVVTVALLAAGSGEPDLFTIDLNDSASRARATELLSAPLPALVRPAIEASFVDLGGVQGAVVVRAVGAAATAGLAPGDVVIKAGTTAIASVADLRAAIAAVRTSGTDLPLELKTGAGASKTATAKVTMVADTIPLRDGSIAYNRALVELQAALKSATTPVARAAAHLNLAIVHMRLSNWDEALAELKDATLPDGPGVSAGTVAYLTGLADEASGRTADAQAAFTKAAAAADARLSADGPLTAPLARQKLQGRR